MPSADSHYAVISPYGLLTQDVYISPYPLFVSLILLGQVHWNLEYDESQCRGFWFTGYPVYSGVFTMYNS